MKYINNSIANFFYVYTKLFIKILYQDCSLTFLHYSSYVSYYEKDLYIFADIGGTEIDKLVHNVEGIVVSLYLVSDTSHVPTALTKTLLQLILFHRKYKKKKNQIFQRFQNF